MAYYIRRLLAMLLSVTACLSAVFGGTAVTPWRADDGETRINDTTGDSSLSPSVLLASALSNGVQCVYVNEKRTAYKMTNRNMALTHTLGKYGNGVTLTNAAAVVGTVLDDDVIPTVKCQENEAVFTVTGSGNHSAVKLEGFTRFGRLLLEKKTAEGWAPVPLASVWGYDGYGVQYRPDGTYGYSFVYESTGAPRTFRARIG